jgi:hypothetical protein
MKPYLLLNSLSSSNFIVITVRRVLKSYSHKGEQDEFHLYVENKIWVEIENKGK